MAIEKITKGKPEVRLYVCVNDRSETDSARPSCGPTITKETVDEVKTWLKEQGLWGKVKVTKVKCFGFCNPDGGVCGFSGRQAGATSEQSERVCDGGDFYKGIQTADDLKELLRDAYDPLKGK